ncbi:MAG: RNA polymerase sigma factor [Dehalococcoidia bacterium]|nr:RNA polymerase sigma factor [Dehalococcoidia bacterium]
MFAWLTGGSSPPARSEKTSDVARRLGKGDTGALEEIYNTCFDRIYSLVFYQVGMDHDNTEDVVQEIWLSAVKSAKNFRGGSEPYTWLCSIAWHKIRDFQRRKYREVAKRHNPGKTYETPDFPELLDTKPLPPEVLEQEEVREMVHDALSSLPEQYRQVLIHMYVDEMPVKEIGKLLGKSPKSVEGLLSRARSSLREAISASVKGNPLK